MVGVETTVAGTGGGEGREGGRGRGKQPLNCT